MHKLQAWIHASRLRTLPLAFSSIITGSAVAYTENRHPNFWLVLSLCIATTLFLQILSNLANDYGDSVKGADNEERLGPKRPLQSGVLTYHEMKIGIALTVLCALFSGSLLIYFSFGAAIQTMHVLFFVLGLTAITAAIKYTVGQNAYGYKGLGDVFVFIFFGLVGVMGSYFLLAQQFHFRIILPAISIGFFSTGVLNLNNMRDYHSDFKAGKHTLVVKIGIEKAKQYHTALIVIALLASVAFVVVYFRSSMQLLFLLTVPLFRKHLAAIKKVESPADFDPFLKQLALSTFIFSLLFAGGMLVGEG